MADSPPEPLPGASDATGADAATDPSPTTSSSEREPPSDEIRQLRAEAKRHRLGQRAAEQERDDLRGRVDQQDRREIERQIGDQLQNPTDFWLTTQLSDLRDEDGGLDQDKLTERLEAVLVDRPHWRRTGPVDFSSGVRAPVKQPKTIGQAFKSALGGGPR